MWVQARLSSSDSDREMCKSKAKKNIFYFLDHNKMYDVIKKDIYQMLKERYFPI